MPTDIVQEIKLRTDIVELISAYVPLRKRGTNYVGLCPFHSEKTGSFNVSQERGFFKCFGCGESGDAFTFIEKREGLSFNEAGEFLARRLGLEWQRRGDTAEKRSQREHLYDVNALAERFFRQSLQRAPEVQEYLLKRGLTKETVEEFRLGYAPGGYEALIRWLRAEKVDLQLAAAADLVLESDRGLRDRFVERVMFPIFDLEGRPIAFGGRTLRADGIPKYLNSRETPIFQKGRTLYGLHLAKRAIPEAGFTVAVEGYMDLIALHQAGVANSVASLGTAITEQHVHILRRYSNQLVMCYDGDSAGMRAAERSSTMFEAADCQVRVAELPQGDDPDTFIKTHGAAEFRALLNRAKPLLDYQIDRLRGGYNLSDEQGRLSFVREAARVIAHSSSHLVRQEYGARLLSLLDRLAGEWYPGDPHRAAQARIALGQEVNRLLRLERVNGRGAQRAPAAPVPQARQSGREQAERYVLRAALSEPQWAARVTEAGVTGEWFTVPELRSVAETLLGTAEAPASDVADRGEALQQDPACAGVLSGLLLEAAPVSDEGLEGCLQLIGRAVKQERAQELQSALEAGDFGSGDPRQDELRALLAELSGLGRRGRRED
jgi:DNA primase